MGFFKCKSKSGVQIEGLSETEKKHLIYIVDNQQKKRRGLLSGLINPQEDEDETKSPINLKKITEINRVIENIPDDEAVNLFIHTKGGGSLACELLIKTLLNHPGTVRAFIPQYAFSAGTMIALAADEIYMGKNAVLGPLDLQIEGLPLNSISDSLEDNQDKGKGYISSFMRSYISKIQADNDRTLQNLLQTKFKGKYREEVMDFFGKDHHHGYPIDVQALREIGLDIHEIKITWRNCSQVTECDLEIQPQQPVVETTEHADELEGEIASPEKELPATAGAVKNDGSDSSESEEEPQVSLASSAVAVGKKIEMQAISQVNLDQEEISGDS